MKKILTTLICICMILTLSTACDSKTNNKKSTKMKTKTEVKKNESGCDVLECIKKVDYKSTKEDIDKLTGKTGVQKQTGTGWTTYSWELNTDDSVEATFYETSKTASISVKFKDVLIKNKKVDFSKAKELKADLSKGEGIEYDDVKERFGGVDGTLIEVSSTSKKYRWVNQKGGYINVTFSNNTGNCTMFIGRF